MEEMIETYQQQLLAQTQYIYYENPISEAVQQAYLATPRHLFVNRYRRWGIKEWHEVNADNLAEHLARLYANHPLILFGEDEKIASSLYSPLTYF